jgi:hypothetical protein
VNVFPVIRLSTLATLLLAGSAGGAAAYDAQLAWAPVEGASGYKIYVSSIPDNPMAAAIVAAGADPTSAPAATPLDAGRLAADADGLVRFVLEDVPSSPAVSFAVTAYDERGNESARSNAMLLTEATVARVTGGDAVADSTEPTK